MSNGTIRGIARESIGWSIALSVLLIVIGLFALAAPLLAGVAVTALIAWLLILGGFGHLVLAWHVRGAGAHFWEALIGLAYIAIGVFLLLHPLAGLVSLTLVLAIYLLAKGIFELAMGLRLRPVPGSGWLVVDAIISLILSALIWRHLPYTAGWVVGTLVGFAILFSGISRLALSLAARKVVAAV
jgi:uncharacterized membrane protein HdeD (DUF308 family)